MKVTKGDLKRLRKMCLDRKECEMILKISKKGSWAYRAAKEMIEGTDKGKI